MWGVFHIRDHQKPTGNWGSVNSKKKSQSGRGSGQIVTPVQAEIERAKALVKKRPSVKQKGKGTKRKATSSKSTTKKKKTDNYGPPGSGTTTEFWKRREKLDEMMNSDTKNVKK